MDHDPYSHVCGCRVPDDERYDRHRVPCDECSSYVDDIWTEVVAFERRFDLKQLQREHWGNDWYIGILAPYASRQRMLHFRKLIEARGDWDTVSDASRTRLRECVANMLSDEEWLLPEMWVLPRSPRVLEDDDDPEQFDFDGVSGFDDYYETWLFWETMKRRKDAWLIAMLDENREACGIELLEEVEMFHRLTIDDALSLIASPVAEVRALGLRIRLELR